MDAEIASYRAAGDEHFAARAADLEDIRDRVLGHLTPGAAGPVIPAGSVVVAADLAYQRSVPPAVNEAASTAMLAGHAGIRVIERR